MTTQILRTSATHKTIHTSARSIFTLLAILSRTHRRAPSRRSVPPPSAASCRTPPVPWSPARRSPSRTPRPPSSALCTATALAPSPSPRCPTATTSLTVTPYRIPLLQPTGIHLDPGDNKSLTDIQLAVGAADQSVTVTETVAGIPLDNGQLSSTITANDLDRLSVVGRDATELQQILPGFAIRNLGPQNTAPDFSRFRSASRRRTPPTARRWPASRSSSTARTSPTPATSARTFRTSTIRSSAKCRCRPPTSAPTSRTARWLSQGVTKSGTSSLSRLALHLRAHLPAQLQ